MINLDQRRDRWRLQQIQAHLWRFPVSRFSAYGPAEGRAWRVDSTLTDGELGLWRSFTEVVTSADPRSALVVIEDDAVVSPLFRRHVQRLLGNAPDGCLALQVGFLTEGSIRPHLSLWGNIRKILRPRSRLRARRPRARTICEGGPFSAQVRSGTQVVAVRAGAGSMLLDALGEPDTPLDHAFQRAALREPGSILRSRRNHAWQAPFRSNIIKASSPTLEAS